MIAVAQRIMAVIAGGFSAILLASTAGDAVAGAYAGDTVGFAIVLIWNACVVGSAVLAWRAARTPITP